MIMSVSRNTNMRKLPENKKLSNTLKIEKVNEKNSGKKEGSSFPI